jgi:tRNA G18 (ribose-2'-O)-methylase SpoU
MKLAIKKTALGTEELLKITHHRNVADLIRKYKQLDYEIIGLEQTDRSIPLANYKTTKNTLLILGEEVNGISAVVAELCENFVEIPMIGNKESFNVSVATGIALYEIRREVLFTER